MFFLILSLSISEVFILCVSSRISDCIFFAISASWFERLHLLICSILSERELTCSDILLISIFGLIAKVAGKRVISINVAIPTHFCQSFFPCMKLTSPDAPMSTILIVRFGLSQDQNGALKYSFFLRIRCAIYIRNNAKVKPIKGEIRSQIITSPAFHQCGAKSFHTEEFVTTKLTPRIDPMSACELDTGRARYHAPRSQIIADMSIERTRTTQKEVVWSAMSPSGSKWRILIATAVQPRSTHKKLSTAAIRTDFFGCSE